MEKIKNICGEDEEGGEGQYLDSALGSTNIFHLRNYLYRSFDRRGVNGLF